MNRPAYFQKSAYALATLSSIAVLMATGTAAIAGYVPPQGRTAPRSGANSTNISRGGDCSSAATSGIVPFAPQSHIGQATSAQPAFVWFTPETGAERTIEFRLAKHLPEGGFEVVYATEFSSDERGPSGVMTLALSETDVRLSPEAMYRWQVVLVCNPNRPSESLVAEADVAVVEGATHLEIALSTTADASEKANRYAEASFWYDALEVAIADGPDGLAALTLLEDLAAIEQQAETQAQAEDPAPENAYSDRLREVIEAMR